MKIKDLKIKIAMALTLVMMGAPVVKAFAAETNVESKTTDEILSMDEQTYSKFLIDEFHRECGAEDTFKKVYEGEGIREEVNGKTGEVRTIDTKTNDVIDSYNYINEVKEVQDAENMTQEEYKNDIKKQVEEAKKEFHQQYGNEDKFNKIFEDEYMIQEVNGKTGEFKETYKGTGLVDTFNVLKDLDDEAKNADMNKEQDDFIATYQEDYSLNTDEGYGAQVSEEAQASK